MGSLLAAGGWSAAAGQALAAVGAGVILAILATIVKLALSVRDSARAVQSLTVAVERLQERQDTDHDRLGAVEAAVTPWPPARRPQSHRRPK